MSGDLIFTGGGIFSRVSNKLGEAYTALANTTGCMSDVFGIASKVAQGIGVGYL